jgi:hypothetical protein
MESVVETTFIGRCRRLQFEQLKSFEIRIHQELQPKPLHGLKQIL